MDKSLALQLAKRCLPHFEGKGVGKLTEIDSVKPRNLHLRQKDPGGYLFRLFACSQEDGLPFVRLGLWTGMGSVDEVQVKSKDDSVSFVVKTVGSHKKLDDELALVDHMSYYNEATFYEQNLSDSICAAGALCPKALLVDRTEDGELTICMTKLPGRGFSRNPEQTRQALQWLAKLHALFWGKPADEVVKSGVAERACFWDLSRRQIELRRMPKDVLRHAAKGIDARLQADKMMTMCHGDPKGANIMYDETEGVSFYDFQWFGKAPASKDLAYFFGVAAHGLSGEETEPELLKFYHEELCKLLEAKSISPPNFEYLWNSYHLALCDLGRWMVGGFSFGNTRLIFGHVKALTTALAGLDSEQACQEKIFKLYPP